MKKIPTSTRTVRAGFDGIVTATDESVLGWEHTPEMLNFRIENGVLTGGLGLTEAKGFSLSSAGARRAYPALPQGVTVKDIFHYRRRSEGEYDDRIVIRTSAGALYHTAVFASDVWHEIAGYTLGEDACAVSYNYGGKDVLLLSSPQSAFAVFDGSEIKTVESAPRFSSVTVHNERVYGTLSGESEQLWFSDDFDPENWNVSGDEGGYISFSDECGDALAAVSFLGYLYIFREHGIYRLTAYGDQSEFSLKKLFTSTGMIYKHTIVLCGDRIVFLTDDGLRAFDGYTVTPVAPELPALTYPTRALGAYYDGAYWLACTTDIGELGTGPYVNNSLLRYGIRDGDMSVLAGCDVHAMTGLRSHTASDLLVSVLTAEGDCALASFSEDGRVFGEATRKIYRTPFNGLGSRAYKTVRAVTLITRYALELRVRADRETYVYALAASDEPQTVYPGKSGRRIGLELRAETGLCHVTVPAVEIDFMRE